MGDDIDGERDRVEGPAWTAESVPQGGATVPARFLVLGPIEYANGLTGSELGGRLQRRVLAMLIARRGETVTADSLIDAVWGEDAPSRRLSSIQTYVSNLRRVVVEPIEYTGAGYRLVAPLEMIDSGMFERLLNTAELELERDPFVASDLLDEALGLWRGDPFEDVADAPGLRHETRRLDALRAVALEARMQAGLASGRIGGLASRMQRWFDQHVFRENFVRLYASVLAAEERQAEALRVLDTTRIRLREELGVSLGPSLQDLEDQLLRQDPSLASARRGRVAARPRHNLPSDGSSFRGREADLTQVLETLWVNRLVTVVGPGGTGKTRLAIEAGLNASEAMVHGVWFVDLASTTSGDAVWREIAATLPVSTVGPHKKPREVVLEDLKSRSMVIILDNCEHILDTAASVASDILAAAPQIRLLATSREPLRLKAEEAIRLQPLPTPPVDSAVDVTAQSPSVRLFVDRARSAGHRGFSPEDAAVIGEVCRRLDGLPLAIELTAALTPLLTPTQIVERLERGAVDVVSQDRDRPHRHSSLSETVAWSYDLLSEIEREVFVRLAVFRGGFDFEDAEAVCSGPRLTESAVSAALGRLVATSLVMPVRRGSANRYAMLETVHSHAARLLAESPEQPELARRHAEHFVALAQRGFDGVWGPHESKWLARLDENRPNLRVAFEWGLVHDQNRAQLLAGSLTWFWIRRNLWSEAVETLNTALAVSAVDSPGRVRARFGLAMLIKWDDPTLATQTLSDVAAAAERYGLWSELWEARFTLGEFAMLANDAERALTAMEETHRWASEVGEFRAVALCCLHCAGLWSMRGDHEVARSWINQAFTASERWGSARVTVYCYQSQGWVELAAGRLEDAFRAFANALHLEDAMWNRPEMPVEAKLGMATVAHAAGDHTGAVAHIQDALVRLEHAQVMSPEDAAGLLRIAACLHAASGNLSRAETLKALAFHRRTVWSRREPMAGWLAAIDWTPSAVAMRCPTDVGSLRHALALHEISGIH